MTNGIEATRLSDGTVRITATGAGGVVKLRVTKEFARRLAARLITASMDGEEAEPEPDGGIMDMLRNIVGGRRG